MATNVRETMKGLSPARRKKIEARAAALIDEEMSLRDLRQALALTQKRMAETLGIGQDGVSRLEKRSDLLLSTLSGLHRSHGRSTLTNRRVPRPGARHALWAVHHGNDSPSSHAPPPQASTGTRRPIITTACLRYESTLEIVQQTANDGSASTTSLDDPYNDQVLLNDLDARIYPLGNTEPHRR